MHKIALIASAFAMLAAPAAASADVFTMKADPSGAPMCFDAMGDKAPLARCAGDRFTLRADPSGAAMCFDALGDKAPLELCTSPELTLKRDPSGATMCFTADGAKAPLRSCLHRIAEVQPQRGAIERVAALLPLNRQ